MNPISWQVADTKNLAAAVEQDELLVVLTDATQAQDPWVAPLIAKAAPSELKKHYNLQTHFGFLGEGFTKPYVVAEWLNPGNSALERRWVVSTLAQRVRARYNLSKLAVLLPSSQQPEHVVMAEDFYTERADSFYKDNHYKTCRILQPDARKTTEHELRFPYQLEFRRWINQNPDELTSLEIGRRLKNFAAKNQCQFHEFDREKLKEEQLNLLLAVGQASDLSPSRLYIVTHRYKDGDKPLCLIGKGITFDTGGINLKPHEAFVNCMKNDMGGAALVANLFMALVAGGYDKPLMLVIPTCENLIGERAVKPGTIIPTRRGKRVFIEHTDAEGRLILADAISYCHDRFNPALTMVMATLTTAALRQFTNFFTPVHFANQTFQDALSKNAAALGEGFTFWPEFFPFNGANKAKAGDLTNMGRMPQDASIGGGSSVAAHFLKEFATKPMIHIDIFASTWNWSGDYPGSGYGATGAPFNSLFVTLRQQEQNLWGYHT